MNKSKFQDLLPKTLYESIRSKSCGLFVGAGISNLEPTNLPGWGKLLDDFIDDAILNRKLSQTIIDELKDALTLGKYLEVAEFLQGNLKEDYIRFLRSIFDNDTLTANRNHELLASLECPLIITTNYDKLIENTIVSKGYNPIVSTAINNDLLEQIHKLTPRRKLLKIHGDINHSDSLVLSETDYIKILDNSMLSVILRSFFHRISFIFVGCSMKDPDVLIFLKQIKFIFKGFTPTHYALIRKSEISELDKYIYKNIYNIEFILIDDFDEVTHFLEYSLELQQEVIISNKFEDALKEHTQINYLEFFLDQLEYYMDVEIEDYYFDSESNYKEMNLDVDINMYKHIKEIFEDFNSIELSKHPMFPSADFIRNYDCIKNINDEITSLPKAKKKQKEELCNKINNTNDDLCDFVKKLKGYIRIRRVSLSNDLIPSDLGRMMLDNYETNYF